MKHVLVALALAVSLPAAAQPRRPRQPDMQIDRAVRQQVIDNASAALVKSYVFPEVAGKVEALLRDRLRAGAYDKLTDAQAFADQLTRDVQSVSKDRHMRVRYSFETVPADIAAGAQPSADDLAEMHKMVARTNGGFVKLERLDGNIGYLRLDYFLPGDEVARLIAAAMTFVANTDALILDLRNNHGGEPGTVALLVSYLYDEAAEVHINDIYDRPSNATRQYWNVGHLPAPRYAGKPVYVLTSKETFSGGEEFSYDVQNLKRAKLVGETTGGGANPGGESRIADHFVIFVPTGRAVSPVTKTNWEGVGVKPDVAVPAAQALDTAYLDALRAQRARISAKDQPGLAREIDDAIAARTPAARPALPPAPRPAR